MLQYKFSSVLLLGLIFVICTSPLPTATAVETKCYECDSTDANCLTNLDEVNSITCDSGKCFIQIDDTGKVTRGCFVEGTTSSAATTCDTSDNCNDFNVCKSCNSSEDAQCAQSASLPATLEICDSNSTQCVVAIDANKHTVRRCATADDVTAESTGSAKLCTGGKCNEGIYPSGRISCYQCTSTADDKKCADVDANTATIQSKPCALYSATDECYTFGTSDNEMSRGCVSDTTSNKCSTPGSIEMCQTCNTSDCNKNSFTTEQDLKCIQCTGTADDSDSCRWGHAATSAKKCSNKIQYNMDELCYTQIQSDIVYRGCYYDRDATLLGAECNAANNCSTCASADGCNNKETSFTCIRCRSDEDELCYNGVTNTTATTPCRNVVTESENYCFHGIWHNVVIRGCIVDADERMQGICHEPSNNQCIICTGVNCNTSKTSGSARAAALKYGLLAAVLLAILAL